MNIAFGVGATNSGEASPSSFSKISSSRNLLYVPTLLATPDILLLRPSAVDGLGPALAGICPADAGLTGGVILSRPPLAADEGLTYLCETPSPPEGRTYVYDVPREAGRSRASSRSSWFEAEGGNGFTADLCGYASG